MKLLFDQNISFRIVRLLPDVFGDCFHVKSVGLNNCNDERIWDFAREKGFTIVTFDADFFEISLIKGCPPKIIWLRTGNLTTSEIVKYFIKNYLNILAFIEVSEQNCLEIN
jgi:predicted nuclease of predicted toxin-antitoxin system